MIGRPAAISRVVIKRDIDRDCKTILLNVTPQCLVADELDVIQDKERMTLQERCNMMVYMLKESERCFPPKSVQLQIATSRRSQY